MDKDRTKGSAEQAKGAVKVAVGKLFGDKKLETEGKSDKAAGKVQNAVGGLKDAVKIGPALSTEASHGIDPDYRCISAAVWRRRILGSQSRVLVTERIPRLRREPERKRIMAYQSNAIFDAHLGATL